jgi:hypothetical protein
MVRLSRRKYYGVLVHRRLVVNLEYKSVLILL